MTCLRTIGLGLIVLSLASTGTVFAQDAEAEGAPPPAASEPAGDEGLPTEVAGAEAQSGAAEGTPQNEDAPQDEAAPRDTGDPTQSGLLSDDQTLAERNSDMEEPRSATDPFEAADETYYFLGAFYRHTWTPSFMLNLFTDENTSTHNPAFGLQFTIRRDGFDIVLSGYYQSYAVEGPFRGKDEPDGETEWIDSSLFAIGFNVDLLWGHMFNDYIGIQYGVGVGIGYVGGELRRNEARPDGNGGYVECAGTMDPSDPGGYCDEAELVNPKWFSGGSTPNLYFRLSLPHLAIRIKPIRQILIRLEGGFDVFSGFYTGATLAYGF